MRGFPNRMMYPDYRLRYAILGAAEINSSSDNKTAVWALMDKIEFDREWYRLGHTLVFFKAGSLAKLEEARDQIVNKLIRYIQGEVYKRIRFVSYAKRRDQRELLVVCQRQFRKFLQMRDWGWFVIIQKTRPLIGQPNPEEELRLLEEKAADTYGKYKEALDVTKGLEGEMSGLKDSIKSLTKTLEEEQGNLSVYTDRQAKANKSKAETEVELATQQNILSNEEANRVELTAAVKGHSGAISVVKKDIEDVELTISKVEQEKTNRDHTIRSLNDEIAEQDEVINKLNKEKKHIAETQAKSSDDLVCAEEKVNHLNSIKGKLEQTLDELEGAYDKEKRGRAALEKERRKVEGELKMTQDLVGELERAKKETEGTIARKEKDIGGLASKLDDEQSLVAKMQKNIKEAQGRVEELEEELEAERQARAKAERQRSDLAREIEQLGERLDEAGGATHAQIELNKKREAEVSKLRKDIEETNIQQESVLG
jgi:myosin heavy chain 6/7